MKRKDNERGPHEVPLPPVRRAMMREWKRADGKDATYVCPAPGDDEQHVTREAVEKFYRRGLELTASIRRTPGGPC